LTMHDNPLDRLAPAIPWVSDWTDVLRRAGQGEAGRIAQGRPLGKHRMVLALIVLAAICIPLAALAAANDWWFLSNTRLAPRPVSAPVVVTEHDWNGHTWQLIAYPSGTDGLCVSVTRKGTDIGAMGCSPFAGVSRTAGTKATPGMTITYLAGTDTGGRPTFIVGPVIDKATHVKIRFTNGQTLRVPTISAPAPLDHIRFYATGLPDSVISPGPNSEPFDLAPEWIAGFDKDENLVACLVPSKAKDGISPLTDCR
jgi:hypothetical protein